MEGTSSLFELDYFDEKAYLTQSGQLYGEAMAMAFGRIYTFGPTFRAEKSKTRRHLTEFWMIEPEMAFFDLDMTLDLAEDLLVYMIGEVLGHCSEELTILERDPAPLERVRKPFPRISYTQAVELLRSDETADMLAARIQALEEENGGACRRTRCKPEAIRSGEEVRTAASGRPRDCHSPAHRGDR